MQGRQNRRKCTISAKYYIRFVTVFHILYFPPLHLSLCLYFCIIFQKQFWVKRHISFCCCISAVFFIS